MWNGNMTAQRNNILPLVCDVSLNRNGTANCESRNENEWSKWNFSDIQCAYYPLASRSLSVLSGGRSLPWSFTNCSHICHTDSCIWLKVRKQILYLQTTRWGNLASAPASLWAMSWERYLTPAPNDTTTKPWSAVSFTHVSKSCRIWKKENES